MIESDSVLIIFFISLCILLSILSYELKRYLRIPVSPTLIVSGIILYECGQYIDKLSGVISMVDLTNPEVIFYIFFPMLLFDSSYSINWYALKKEIFQIIILATSVFLSCSVLTAISLKYIFGYYYTNNQLLLIGVIINASDHTAIDAMLKEIYSSEYLEMLISGEALFLEASVFVMFEVLLDSDTSGFTEVKQIAKLFFRLVLGGLGLGIGFAISAGFVIRRKLNELFIEFNILIIASYLLFWVCELGYVKFSGGVAVITYGLFMSAYGKTFISPMVEGQIEQLIQLISRNLQSILFVSAGILFAYICNRSTDSLHATDYYTLFLLFPLTYVIRAAVLFVHFPLLRKIGYKMTFKELVVLCFSGLKGVFSVALTLFIINGEEFDDHFRDLVGYFGIGIATLSIIFGGPAIKFIVKKSGLEDLTQIEENMLISVTGALFNLTEEKIEELHNSGDAILVDFQKVEEFCGIEKLVCSIIKKTKSGSQYMEENKSLPIKILIENYQNSNISGNEEIKNEIRRRFFATLKGLYWERFEEGLCNGETAIFLIDSVLISLDKDCGECMSDWKHLLSILYSEKLNRFLKRMLKIKGFSSLSRKILYQIMIMLYDAGNNFITCHLECEKLIDEMDIDLDKKIFKKVMKESHKQIAKCEKFMNIHIIDCYPEVLANVQTTRCCKNLLYKQREMITDIYEHGIIEELEYDALINSIDSSLKVISFQGFPSIPVLKDIISYRFKSVSNEDLEQLISKITEFEFPPDHIFYSENEEPKGAYFIIRGRVQEKSSWINQELIIGNIVGVQHLLEEYSHTTTSTAVAVTHGVAALIPKEIITMEAFIDDLYAEASEEIVLLNRKRYELIGVKEEIVVDVIKKSTVLSLNTGKKRKFTNGALVLKGNISNRNQVWIVRPKNKTRTINENCIVLELPKDFAYSYDENYSIGEAFKKFSGNVDRFSTPFSHHRRESTSVESTAMLFKATTIDFDKKKP